MTTSLLASLLWSIRLDQETITSQENENDWNVTQLITAKFPQKHSKPKRNCNTEHTILAIMGTYVYFAVNTISFLLFGSLCLYFYIFSSCSGYLIHCTLLHLLQNLFYLAVFTCRGCDLINAGEDSFTLDRKKIL